MCSLHLGMGAQLEVLAAKLTAPAGTAYAGETIELRGPHRARRGGDARARRRRLAARGHRDGERRRHVQGERRGRDGLPRAHRGGREPGGDGDACSHVPKVKFKAAKGRLKVSTTPAAKGLTARFEERRGSGWRTFATVKLDAAGRASVKERAGRLRACSTRGKAELATSKTVRR